jgi:hypothetical protein
MTPTERRGWKEALADTREQWRAAYEGEPTRVSEVLGRVVLDRDESKDTTELRLVA